jgi:hypothetical protein
MNDVPGTLFTVSKIETRDVSPTDPKKSRSHQPQPAPTRVPQRIMSAQDCTNMNQHIVFHAPVHACCECDRKKANFVPGVTEP